MSSLPCPAELLAELSQLLDEALELAPAARAAWLDGIATDHPAALPWLRRMLLERAAFAPDWLEAPLLDGGETHDDQTDASQAATIGPYRLVALLGSGGMGKVHAAERLGGVAGHRVALKVIRRGMDTDEVLRRFGREREILAQLNHPNITRLIDGGATESGQAWLAMELVTGEPITTWCDSRRATLTERVALFTTVCEAVQHAHRNLIVHRDLKPSNILVDVEGRVKLLDFGIAKLLGDTSDAETQAHARPFTREYAAPEQHGSGRITTATDIYQLGLVLYELLCGNRAAGTGHGVPITRLSTGFARATAGEQNAVADARRSSPANLRKALGGDLEKVVAQATHEEPARRYASAAALAEDLRHWLDGQPVLAAGNSRRYKVGKFLRRHYTAAFIVGLLALGLVAATVSALAVAQRERIERERADAVAGFLESLFRRADPRVGLNADTRVADLLESATTMAVAQQSVGTPARIHLLLGIGRSLQGLERYAQARAAFLEANRLARDAALDDQRAEIAEALAYSNLEWGNSSTVDADAQATGLSELVAAPSPLRRALAHAALGFDANNHDQIETCETELALALQARQELAQFEADIVPAVLLVRGENLTELGRFEQAGEVLREAVQQHEQRYGAVHPRTLNARLGYLDNEVSLQHLDIEPSLREVIRGLRERLGEAHHDTRAALNLLGRLYLAQGRTSEALATFQSAPEPGANVSGYNRAVDYANIGVTAWRLGDQALARTELQRVFEALGEEDANSAPALYARAALAEMDCAAGTDSGAVTRLKAMATQPQPPGEARDLAGLAFAQCLHALQRDAEAAAVLPAVTDALRVHMGDRHADTRTAEELLRQVQRMP